MARSTASVSVRVWLVAIVVGMIAIFGGATVFAQSDGQGPVELGEVSAEISTPLELPASVAEVEAVLMPALERASELMIDESAEPRFSAEIQLPQGTERSSLSAACDPPVTTIDDHIACYNSLPAAVIYNVSINSGGALPSAPRPLNNSNGATFNLIGNAQTLGGLDQFRLFTIINGKAKFSNITLVDGYAGADCDTLVGACAGGAVYIGSSGIVTFSQTTISSSFANSGGGIYVKSGGIASFEDSVINDNRSIRGGGITIWGTATLINTAVTNNRTLQNNANGVGNGGGMFIGTDTGVTMINSTFLNNQAILSGGAIFQFQTATLNVTNSTFTNNSAAEPGGALAIRDGDLTVNSSTFSNNSTEDRGGALHATVTTGTVLINNSTFSGNSATGAGGAINSGTLLTVRSSTLYDNSANNGGGIHYSDDAARVFSNTIFANNTGGDCANASGTVNVTFDSVIDSDGSCGDAAQHTLAEINLGPLQDNGGPTETHALRGPSVAIDAATADPTITTDQRGMSRPQGDGSPDIGAYELVYTPCLLTFPLDVATETELNTAISCFSASWDGGSSVINLTADIDLSANTVAIENSAGSALTINGNGHSIDGNNLARIINVQSGAVSINKLTLERGAADAVACAGQTIACGGSLFVATTAGVTLTQVSVLNNSADQAAGIAVSGQGSLTVDSSTISGNSQGGIGFYSSGVLTVNNSTISGNSADFGAGIEFTNGTATVSHSTIYDNAATVQGGGIFHGSNQALALSNSIVASNVGGDCEDPFGFLSANASNIDSDGSCDGATQQSSAEINLGPLQHNGGPTWTHALIEGSVAIDAATADPAIAADQRGLQRPQRNGPDIGAFELPLIACPLDFPISVASEAALNEAIVCFNQALDDGDYAINVTDDIVLTANTTPIDSVTLADKTLTIDGADHAIDGNDVARILNLQTGDVIVSNLTLQRGSADAIDCRNVTISCGGGIFMAPETSLSLEQSTVMSNTAGLGAGISNDGGTLTVHRSTISGNMASEQGGGIDIFEGALTIHNSTFSDNSAPFGGAIFNGSPAVTLRNSTLSNNSALGSGGAVYSEAGVLVSYNTIFANSPMGGDCNGAGGTFTIDSSNIDSDGSCGDATQHGEVAIALGPLQDNGGPTHTHAIPAASVATNQATPDANISTDQRGVARPQGSAPDVGAYEVEDLNCTLPPPINVATEAALNNAIFCFNQQTAGSFTVLLSADIRLSGETLAVNNPSNALLFFGGNSNEIDGKNVARILNIEDGNVLVSNMTLQGGAGSTANCPSGTCGGSIYLADGAELSLAASSIINSSAESGGAIYSRGALTIQNSTLSGNVATTGSGGAIFAPVGTVTIRNSTLSGNSAVSGGGLFSGNTVTTIRSSTFNNNAATGFGGALFVQFGTVTASNSIFANSSNGGDCFNVSTLNNAVSNIDSDGTCGEAEQYSSSAIKLGPLQNNGGSSDTHALLPLSVAIDSGTPDPLVGFDQRGIDRLQGGAPDIGAFELEQVPCTLTQPISVASQQDLNDAINCFNLAAAGEFPIDIAGNVALNTDTLPINNTAGGILIISGNGHVIDGSNFAQILNVEAGDVRVDTITLRRGVGAASTCGLGAQACGGAVTVAPGAKFSLLFSTVADSTADYGGGGISSRGALTVSHSTVSGNSADENGGGVYLEGAAVAVIVNSTVSGNSAEFGGGLFNSSVAPSIRSSTFSANEATVQGGAIYSSFGTVTVHNSILANSVSGSDCFIVSGSLVSETTSFDSDGSCGDAVQHTGAEINLGPLQDNGGPTWTHALQAGSVAIDAATSDPAITTDQRGFPRNHGSADDIGAFEFGSVPTAVGYISTSAQTSGQAIAALLGVVTLSLLSLIVLRRRARRHNISGS